MVVSLVAVTPFPFFSTGKVQVERSDEQTGVVTAALGHIGAAREKTRVEGPP